MKFRKYISLFILLGFFIAITPRFWWHDCHDHNEVELSGKVHFEKDNCFACDFDLGEIETPFQLNFNFSASSSLYDIVDEAFSFNSSLKGFALRGPPSLFRNQS